MSKKIRLIARLDVKDENLVKGIQLEGLRKLGNPNEYAKEYYSEGIDELLYIPDNSQEQFGNILEHNMRPIYEAAMLQGYKIWKADDLS